MSKTELRAVRTTKQWDKLNHEIESTVRDLINGEDKAALNLALLVRMIFNESNQSDRESIVNKILECAFINSEAFWHSRDAWMDEHAPEIPVQAHKKRA